jgi:hypothetical protein
MNRDEFFAELDKLTEQEIETRLPQWDREQLLLVQEYLDEKAEQTKAAPSAQIDSSTKEEALRVSVEAAKRTHSMALMAMILAVGAMMAAITSALVAFLALQGWTISW